MTPIGWIVRVWCGYEEFDDPPYDTTLYISGYADASEAVEAVRRYRGKDNEQMEALDGILPGSGPQPKPAEVRKIGGV
jgi:hypothetical protein